MMKKLCDKRCVIGEGPYWNDRTQTIWFTNGFADEICSFKPETGELSVRPVPVGVAAFAFDEENRMIVSRSDGVFVLLEDNTTVPIYDTEKYAIQYANDMKVGPDGRIYVGTQSEKRLGISDQVDGKLYSISKDGTVRTLLDGLILSNGMEWSMDEKRFYHTDSNTRIIREYSFDKESGEIVFTGREVTVPGVDGFTIDRQDRIIAACWGRGHLAVVDTGLMEVIDYIDLPASVPASCAFAGKEMDKLVITTATYGIDAEKDPNTGFSYICDYPIGGRKAYLFASK